MAHISGPDQDLLLFDYPLTGTFELSLEAPCGSWQEAGCSYAGIIAEPFWIGGSGQIFPVGASETLGRPWKLNRLNDFNNLSIQVSPSKVRYIVNGHLFYEDSDPSPTSPWLALFTRSERHTAWRSFRVKGEPKIPEEVRLSVSDRLEGWLSSLSNETQPARRTAVTTDRFGNTIVGMRRLGKGSNAPPGPRPAINPDDYDWSAQDGEIRRPAPSLRPTRRTPDTMVPIRNCSLPHHSMKAC